MNLDQFGMDTITLAGPLTGKLRTIRDAGFTQVMLNATDLADYPGGVEAAIEVVQASELRVTGFQVLRDFEGLSGHLHAYKIDVAKAMLGMCHALDAPVLLVCSSTSAHATDAGERLAQDLQKLAMLALPFGIRIAYEALSWGRHVNDFTRAAAIVQDADRSNLGLCLDSFHMLANGAGLDGLDAIDPGKVFLVQLSDFMWQEIRTREDRIETARHYRVFPGEGAHSTQVAELVRRLDGIGYRGDYSFEVFNDDYRQLPPPMVAERAWRAARRVTDTVPRRSLPLRAVR